MREIFGVTGGTGCGKTTFLKVLEEQGFLTIDCDALYHDLLRENAAMLAAIGAAFPGTVVNGALQRKALGQIVFADPAALKALSAITDPFVGAMTHGERLERVNDELNSFMEHGSFSQEEGMEELIRRTAGILSDELLYMKFLQGIPIAGVVGGAGDAVYMNRISEYARLKYHRRFCLERLKKEYNPSSHLN